MKKILLILACVLGTFICSSTANAGYRRTVMGYDSRGNAIIRVMWVADHLDYPRTIYDRRTYPTSLRRDPESFSVSPTPSLAAYRVYPASYSAADYYAPVAPEGSYSYSR